jgi:hypothetical protein
MKQTLSSKKPGLQSADPKSKPGTPRALGGGPDQPPGGPGGTKAQVISTNLKTRKEHKTTGRGLPVWGEIKDLEICHHF